MSKTREQLLARLEGSTAPAAERARLELELAAVEQAAGSFAAAAAAARRARGLAPDLEDAQIAEAEALLGLRCADDVLGLTAEAHAARGSRPWIWLMMARALALRGEHEQAIKATIAGLRDQRGVPALWEELARGWLRVGNLDGAAEAIAALRDLGATAQAAPLELAVERARAGTPGPEVAAQLERELPGGVGALLAEGAAALDRRDLDGAERAARAILARSPSSAEGWTLVASVHAVRGAFAAAADAAAHAVLAGGAIAATWEALITHRLAAGEIDQAIEDARDAIARHPRTGRLWLLLANALERGGRPRGAYAAARVSLGLHPESTLVGAADQLRRRLDAAAVVDLDRRFASGAPLPDVADLLQLDPA